MNTLHGTETLFIEAGAKSGDERRLEGKGIPKAGGDGGGSRGDHVVVVEVKRATTPEREAAAAKAAAAADEEGEEEPAAKRVKTAEAGPAESMTDLEKLLAEKKRQLLAKLQQKKGPVEVD